MATHGHHNNGTNNVARTLVTTPQRSPTIPTINNNVVRSGITITPIINQSPNTRTGNNKPLITTAYHHNGNCCSLTTEYNVTTINNNNNNKQQQQ